MAVCWLLLDRKLARFVATVVFPQPPLELAIMIRTGACVWTTRERSPDEGVSEVVELLAPVVLFIAIGSILIYTLVLDCFLISFLGSSSMLRIALILMLLGGIITATLYTENLQRVFSFTKKVSTQHQLRKSAEQVYYKWQDDQGHWHMSDTVPEGIEATRVLVDTTANIIPKINVSAAEIKESSEFTPQPAVGVPMTTNPLQVPELIDRAKDVERQLQERQLNLEKALR